MALIAWGIVMFHVLTGCVPGENAPPSTTASPPSSAPVASAGRGQNNTPPGTVVTLDGSGSTSPSGRSLTYDWTLTSKPPDRAAVLANPTTIHPSFIVNRAGDYLAQLIVNDGTVNSLPDTVTITAH